MAFRPIRSVALAVALASWPGVAGAQEETGPPETAGQARVRATETIPMPAPLSFRRLNLEGLPQGTATDLEQDAIGFIWIGTESGLVRYDGHRTIVYKDQLTSGSVNDVTAADKGAVWVATPKGVNLYDPDTDEFRQFIPNRDDPGSLRTETVTTIFRDSKDRVWIANGDVQAGGVSLFQPETETFKHFADGPLAAPITAIAEDSEGELWLGATDALLRFEPSKGADYYRLPADADAVVQVNAIATDGGSIWVGTNAGLYEFERSSETFTHYVNEGSNPESLSDNLVTSLLVDTGGNLWIGTQNGLNRFDKNKKTFIRHHHEPGNLASLPYSWIRSLFQDREGIVWVGTVRGIAMFDELRRQLAMYRTRSYTPLCFESSKDGALWVGTVHGGLYRFERERGRIKIFNRLEDSASGATLDLHDLIIVSIHEEEEGFLWMALAGGGLVKFWPETGQFRQYIADESSAWLNAIYKAPTGNLWLGSWGGGVLEFDPRTEKFTPYRTSNSGMSSDHVYALTPDATKANGLWIGTAQGGLNHLNTETGDVVVYANKPADPTSISSNDVTSIFDGGEDGSLWLGTYGGGINRLDLATGEFERITTSNSALTHNDVLGIVRDDTGKLWVSTNGGGLLRLDPKTREFVHYSAADGLPSDEFTEAAFGRAADGELFFGSPDGFVTFYPDRLSRVTALPPIAISGLSILNQQVTVQHPLQEFPSEIEIAHDDSFEFRFAALSFGAPDQNRYAYKLEGFDDNWIETTQPAATYTKLGGGDFVFRVRGANRHGVWSETGAAISFAVKPPLYLRWWAFCLYGLAFLAIVVASIRYFRLRIKRLEQENRLIAVERDLELTGAVQAGFLPHQNEFSSESVQLYGFYRAADQASGDWWWYEPMENGKHLVLVGDVTGHGPGPAMVTAAVATAFRVLSTTGQFDTAGKLSVLNREVLRVSNGDYLMTAMVFELDPTTGQFSLYGIGGPPIMRLGESGRPRLVPCRGTPLGFPEFTPGHVTGELRPGERILLYSDGIPEIEMANGRLLGNRQFAKIFEQTRELALSNAASSIVASAEHWSSGPQQDDWTFALLEWSGPQGGVVPPERPQ